MRLARRLAEHSAYAPLMSFAGRTRALVLPPIPCRIGGFGGAQGLASFLKEGGFAAVVDATHPFASRMSENAAAACAELGVALTVLTRPAWTRQAGDTWIEVDGAGGAAAALGDVPRTVLLAIGRQELAAFRGAGAHRFLVRAVDAPAPDTLPHGARVITARGPFETRQEIDLLKNEAIDVVVSKNSGGEATYGKIAAARQLGLPVIMIKRPRAPTERDLHDAEDVLAWLKALRDGPHGTAP